jgi:hypothetical protein
MLVQFFPLFCSFGVLEAKFSLFGLCCPQRAEERSPSGEKSLITKIILKRMAFCFQINP